MTVITWDNGASVLSLPIWLNETLDLGASPTTHPVEADSPISDHVEVQNAKGSFDVVISNTPIRPNEYGGVGKPLESPMLFLAKKPESVAVRVPIYNSPPISLSGIGRILVQGSEDFEIKGVSRTQEIRQLQTRALQWDLPFDACRDVLATLRKLQVARTLVTVIFSYGFVPSAFLTRVTAKRDDAYGGDALAINVAFEKLRVVSSEIVATPAPTEPRAKPKTAKGSQGKDDKKARSASVLTPVFEALGIKPK